MDESVSISSNLSRVKIGETVFMGRNISRDLADRIEERANELKQYDLTEHEILFQIMKEFANGSHIDIAQDDWGQVTGIDKMPTPTMNIPDSGKPDGIVPELYPHDDQHAKNYVATGSKINSEPYPMAPEPAVNDRNIPEESFYPKIEEIPIYEAHNERTDMPNILKDSNKDDQPYIPVRIVGSDLDISVPENEQIEDLADQEGEPDKLYIEEGLNEEEPITETETKLAKFVYAEKGNCEICKPFHGRVFDLNDVIHRPILPSEGLGYTTTHPNCQCYYNRQKTTRKELSSHSKDEQKNSSNIKRHIARKAKSKELHTVFPDGRLSKRTRGTNPIYETLAIREAVTGLKHEFNWLTENYIGRLKQIQTRDGGEWLVIRASEETVTDHRSEGDPYRRKLSANELFATTRTAIGKDMDINHYGREYATGGKIIDAEFDPELGQSQMLVLEKDPEILDAIKSGVIEAVSINGGAPREQNIECGSTECFLVPRGVVLGEDDGIALTYVVTNPGGMNWRGKSIPKAEPGVKTTKIEIL